MRKRDMERALEMARKAVGVLACVGGESKLVDRGTGEETRIRPYAMGAAVALGLLHLYASGESEPPENQFDYAIRVIRCAVDADREFVPGEGE